jgi:hypothetical protein
MHFYPHLCTPRKTYQLVTYPEIALVHAHLTPKYFTVELLEKKVYLGGTPSVLKYLTFDFFDTTLTTCLIQKIQNYILF